MNRKLIVVVDMQNDFISGSLAVPGAQEIVGPMHDYLSEQFVQGHMAAFTMCMHPRDHCSFIEQGGKWPSHCVTGTWGSMLQPGLLLMAKEWGYHCRIFHKGTNKDLEEYSGAKAIKPFLDTNDFSTIEICGLARDYCVQDTYIDLLQYGYSPDVLEHLCRAVNA